MQNELLLSIFELCDEVNCVLMDKKLRLRFFFLFVLFLVIVEVLIGGKIAAVNWLGIFGLLIVSNVFVGCEQSSVHSKFFIVDEDVDGEVLVSYDELLCAEIGVGS